MTEIRRPKDYETYSEEGKIAAEKILDEVKKNDQDHVITIKN